MASGFLRSFQVAILGLIATSLTSCMSSTSLQSSTSATSSTSAKADTPKVVATTTILCDLVRQIAEETVDLTCLLKPGVDGHSYQPTPADRKAIETAQLILYSGYNFEPGLIKLIQSTSNSAPKIAIAETAVPQPLIGHEHGEDSNHSDDHNDAEAANTPDPHVWQNAAYGAKMTQVINTALINLKPSYKDKYTQNSTALIRTFNQLHAWIQTQINTIPNHTRKLITTHDALHYYAKAYNLPITTALQGLSTEAKPTATQVKQLITEVKSTGVPTIFTEAVVNPKLIEAVARDAGVKVSDRPLHTDSIGEAGSEADSYPKMLIANTQTIVEGLNGRFVPFQFK